MASEGLAVVAFQPRSAGSTGNFCVCIGSTLQTFVLQYVRYVLVLQCWGYISLLGRIPSVRACFGVVGSDRPAVGAYEV